MANENLQKVNTTKMSFGEKLKNGYNPMIEGVRWTEKHAPQIDKLWKQIPNRLRQMLIFVAVFLFASGIQGDWIVILVHLYKYFKLQNDDKSALDDTSFFSKDEYGSLVFFISISVIVSYVIYFAIGGFLQWYFYVRQRDRSHEWKCQPNNFLSPELERHEIIVGSLSLLFSSSLAGFVAWYTVNDGKYLKVYYQANEYGWLWFFLQVPIVFMYQDYGTYLIHRAYHTPFLYKHFHKLHHKYKQPTAFSVTAIHPVEILNVQIMLLSPLVLVPVHWFLFYATAIYIYYHGILDHSGITFKAHWWQPWQPDAIFHDNHHQYFHVNFGFNMTLWDHLHGTYRQKNRIYREDIFYGKGKAIDEVTPEELAKDIAERKSENPNAYRSNANENDLTEEDLKTM